MTTKTATILTLAPALLLLLPISGCEDKCIADCGIAGSATTASDGSQTMSGFQPMTDSGTGTLPGNCNQDTQDATEWITQNRECTYSVDCTLLDALCYQDLSQCGQVAVSKDADSTQWSDLHDALVGCTCGAPACGTGISCNEGLCEAIGPADNCAELESDAEDFIAANQTCVNDDDCVLAAADCYAGPGVTCGSLALDTNANLATWAAMNTVLEACNPCEAKECGARAVCGQDGLCSSVFP